jgi:hypothetical protein
MIDLYLVLRSPFLTQVYFDGSIRICGSAI